MPSIIYDLTSAICTILFGTLIQQACESRFLSQKRIRVEFETSTEQWRFYQRTKFALCAGPREHLCNIMGAGPE